MSTELVVPGDISEVTIDGVTESVTDNDRRSGSDNDGDGEWCRIDNQYHNPEESSTDYNYYFFIDVTWVLYLHQPDFLLLHPSPFHNSQLPPSIVTPPLTVTLTISTTKTPPDYTVSGPLCTTTLPPSLLLVLHPYSSVQHYWSFVSYKNLSRSNKNNQKSNVNF